MLSFKLIGFLLGLNAFMQHAITSPSSKGFERGKKYHVATRIGNLSGDFRESSGLEYMTGNTFLTHKDSGGSPVLYQFDFSGNITDSLTFYTIDNIDWEDITQDNAGNYYIGDFGNNSNTRKDLCIYKISPLGKEKITFDYANQQNFPPGRKNRVFDCEAFFWHNGFLYLFSKSRGSNNVFAYKIPAKEGHYSISPIDTIKIPQMITAADIDRDNNRFGLLGYGMIYYFNLPENDKIFSRPERAIRFTKGGQSEAFVFLPGGDALITNESGKIFLLQQKLK